MPTFTAWCRDDDDEDCTTWVSAIDAPDRETALTLAAAQCADDWGLEGIDRCSVRCIGLAEGDVNLVYWVD